MDQSIVRSSDLHAVQSLMADIQLKNMSSPAPKSQEQSEKSKKYDRQLRIVISVVINVFLITQTWVCNMVGNTVLFQKTCVRLSIET
jgi:hypothetical protein